jgi:hypothetical protein
MILVLNVLMVILEFQNAQLSHQVFLLLTFKISQLVPLPFLTVP